MNNMCKECMFDAPHENCCKIECGEHEFCRGCKSKARNKGTYPCNFKAGGTGMSYTIGNHDDITTAILALDMFTKNWCMNCAETEKQGEPVFRCSECEFHGHDSMCAIKIFANNHDSDFDMSRFGCMSR